MGAIARFYRHGLGKADLRIRFFSGYRSDWTGWKWELGDFAQLRHPLKDNVTLTLHLLNATESMNITV
jgi:hypothetical protein